MTARHFASLAPAALAAALLLGLQACTAIAPAGPGDRAELDKSARAALANAAKHDRHIAAALNEARGCAVFPTVGKGAALFGLAYGQGVFYEHNQLTGYCDLTQGLVGLALGGQGYTEIIFLMSPDAVTRFKHGVYTLNSQASGVLFYVDAASQASYDDDVAEYPYDGCGLMLEASIGTQQLRFQPVLGEAVH